jgi:hypothetical protein
MRETALTNSSTSSKYSRQERVYFTLLLALIVIVSITFTLLFQVK